VIGAVPGFLGFQTLKTVIECGKNIVDISFFAEDPFELDALAQQKNVTAVVDCGVAPGMCNILLGLSQRENDRGEL
jgi:lysine 6-dehydrogenase